MIIAGVDEAGRGPLAGPVVAAAVLWDGEVSSFPDSKTISHSERLNYYSQILRDAIAVSVASVSPFIIDSLDIRRASLWAMKIAVEKLGIVPELVLVDGRDKIPGLSIPHKPIVNGDATVPIIAAASIVAKVSRDMLMLALDSLFPQYNFAKHKGYATVEHYARLMDNGPCIIHRKSFKLFRDSFRDCSIQSF